MYVGYHINLVFNAKKQPDFVVRISESREKVMIDNYFNHVWHCKEITSLLFKSRSDRFHNAGHFRLILHMKKMHGLHENKECFKRVCLSFA